MIYEVFGDRCGRQLGQCDSNFCGMKPSKVSLAVRDRSLGRRASTSEAAAAGGEGTSTSGRLGRGGADKARRASFLWPKGSTEGGTNGRHKMCDCWLTCSFACCSSLSLQPATALGCSEQQAALLFAVCHLCPPQATTAHLHRLPLLSRWLACWVGWGLSRPPLDPWHTRTHRCHRQQQTGGGVVTLALCPCLDSLSFLPHPHQGQHLQWAWHYHGSATSSIPLVMTVHPIHMHNHHRHLRHRMLPGRAALRCRVLHWHLCTTTNTTYRGR